MGNWLEGNFELDDLNPFKEGGILGYKGLMWGLGEAITSPFRWLGLIKPPTGEPKIGIPAAAEKVGETVDWAKGLIDEGKEWVGEKYEEGKEWIDDRVDDAKTVYNDAKTLIGGAYDDAKTLVGDTKDFIVDAFESVKTGAGQIITPVSDLFSSLADAIKGEGLLKGVTGIKMPEIRMPEIRMPEIKMPSVGLPLALAGVGITALLILGGVI